MPKFVSECGFIINLSGIPSENELRIVSDAGVHEVSTALEAGELTADGYFDILERTAKTVYECLSCGQLYIEQDDGSFSVFSPKGAYGRVSEN